MLVAGEGSYCDQHEAERRRESDARRGTAAQRGYGRKWQAARAQWLAEHPFCQCEECDEGRVRLRAAIVVDHKIPHRGDLKLMWSRSNWQSMAKECHDKKTAREDGGFGRPRGPRKSTGLG